LVGGDGLDLALAEKAARGVDLLGGQGVALERRESQDRARPRLDRDVSELDGRFRDAPARRILRRRHAGDREIAGGGAPERHAESGQEITSTDLIRHHGLLSWSAFSPTTTVTVWMRLRPADGCVRPCTSVARACSW